MTRADACPRCLALVDKGKLDFEMINWLRGGAADALANDGSGKCCVDCHSAETLCKFDSGMTFDMARVAVGNDRQLSRRLPGQPMGLILAGYMKASKPGDLDEHHERLERLRPGWRDGGDDGRPPS